MLGVTNLHRELTGSNTTNYELDVNRAFTTAATESEERNILSILQVIERKENPFVNPPKEKRLHNIQTKEVMTDDIRIQLLDVEGIGLTAYEKLREERFCTKSVRLSDVIHRTYLKTFISLHKSSDPKNAPKKGTLKRQDAEMYRMLEIAKERGKSMEELLTYDVCASSYLLNEEGLITSATKSHIVQEMEKGNSPKVLPPSSLKTGCIVDVMANVRKIKVNDMDDFGEFCDGMMQLVQHASKGASRIDLVFDSYLDRSIKDSERQKRETKTPIDLMEMDRKTPIPVQMDRFWPSNKNKANLETLLHRTALCHSWDPSVAEVVVSSFDVLDGTGRLSYIWSGGSVTEAPKLNAEIEEADLRTVLHAVHATKGGAKRLLVLSSDTDVLILFLYHWNELRSEGLEELWIKTGVRDTSRYVPVHDLAENIGQDLCRVLPAVHTLTGCDYTSKFGTKHAAMRADPGKYLLQFGTMIDIDRQVVEAEEYLVQVFKKSQSCKTLDQLRCHLYHHSKRPCLDDLPPTSHAAELHIKRAFYCTNLMMNILAIQPTKLDPCLYGYEELDDLLVPQQGKHPIPEEYTVRCNCAKCATERCSCRKNHLPCTSFCNCHSGVTAMNGSDCKKPTWLMNVLFPYPAITDFCRNLGASQF